MARILSAIAKVTSFALDRSLLLLGAICLPFVASPGCRDASDSPDGAQQRTLVVRLVDGEGKPVQGAHVGDYVRFGRPSERPVDESGWYYAAHAISDADGTARVVDEQRFLTCIVARHVARKLVAVQPISRRQLNNGVTVTMQPQCRVSGRLGSNELEARHREITWSNVYVYLGEERPLGCDSEQADFHFYLPPGTYRLNPYGLETYQTCQTVTVPPGQSELELGTIDLPARAWALLQGEPAPELLEVVAWKNSQPLKLSDLRGRVVLLEFWGVWCGNCVVQMPELFSLYKKHREDLVIIGIHVDCGERIDSVAKLDEKLAEVKDRLWKGEDIPFPVALVRERQVPFRPDIEKKARCPLAAAYGVSGYPTGVLIDRHGRVAGVYTAGYTPDEILLEKTLREK